MFFSFPSPKNSKAYAACGSGDFSAIHGHLSSGRKPSVPTFPEARREAERLFASGNASGHVNALCMRADDSIWMVEFGPMGGWKKVWNFGRGY